MKCVKFIFFILLVAFDSSIGFSQMNMQEGGGGSFGTALMVNALYGINRTNIYGQGTVPSYTGSSTGVGIEYAIGKQRLNFGPYFNYKTINLENTANSESQSEIVTGSSSVLGIKAVSSGVYVKIGYVSTNYQDKTVGTLNNNLNLDANGFELGGGFIHYFGKYVRVNWGADLNQIALKPGEVVGISQRLDFTDYLINISLTFILPSTGGR